MTTQQIKPLRLYVVRLRREAYVLAKDEADALGTLDTPCPGHIGANTEPLRT
jgi:hypothetical protein